MPKASIIVPCYNAEQFIDEMIESILNQTLQDFELICVNNNSSDRTLEILRSYEEQYENIFVEEEPTPGSGLARNVGLARAKGEWLFFLDADDFSAPTLLEDSIVWGEAHDADVVVFRAQKYDMRTGEKQPMDWAFNTRWLPEGQVAFDPAEFAPHVLTAFQNWTWNKAFRADFVREQEIVFQDTHRTTDLLFTCRALTEAKTIAVLDKTLHSYRIGNQSSAFQTSYKYPNDFYYGFKALREALEAHGTWELYHESFVNWAMGGIYSNLMLANSLESLKAIIDCMREEGLATLDVPSIARENAYEERYWVMCDKIANSTDEELLFHLFELQRKEASNLEIELSRANLKCEEVRKETIAELDERIGELNEKLDDAWGEVRTEKNKMKNLKASKEWKIGRLATSPVRKAKEAMEQLKR